jgi:hypothetical protein
MKTLLSFARVVLLLTAATLAPRSFAECQPDTMYLGRWQRFHSTVPGVKASRGFSDGYEQYTLPGSSEDEVRQN